MATLTTPTEAKLSQANPAHAVGDEIRPLRRLEYELLVEHGLLVDERTELLNGRLVRMSPQYDPQASAVEERKDLGEKAEAYARAAIPEYWVVNIPSRCIAVHLDPGNGRYRRITTHGRGEAVRLHAFPDSGATGPWRRASFTIC